MSWDNFLGLQFVYVAWYFLYIGYQGNVVECGIQESGLIYLKSGLVRLLPITNGFPLPPDLG